MTHEDFVTYEQAVKLKELGFDWECNHYYNTQTKKFSPVDWYDYDGDVDADDLYDSSPPKDIVSYRVSAPTLAQVQKWLREIKQIYLFVTMEDSHYYWYIDKDFQIGNSKSYEEALSIGIDKAIKLLANRVKAK